MDLIKCIVLDRQKRHYSNPFYTRGYACVHMYMHACMHACMHAPHVL